jgi:hypothetical protein
MTDSIRRTLSTSSVSFYDQTTPSPRVGSLKPQEDSLSSFEDEKAPLLETSSASTRSFLKDVIEYLDVLVNRFIRACTKFKNDLRSLKKEPLKTHQAMGGSREAIQAMEEIRFYRALSPSSVDLITIAQARAQGFTYCNGNKVLSQEIDLPSSVSNELLFVPIVMKSKETAVFVVDFQNRSIEFYDPEGRSSEELAETRSLRQYLESTYSGLTVSENRTPHTQDSYNSALYVYEFIGIRSTHSFDRACALNAQLTQNDVEGPLRSTLLRHLITAYIPERKALPGFEI